MSANMVPNSYASTGLEGAKGNGFLGLMQEMEAPAASLNVDNISQNIGFVGSIASEGRLEKKRGAKKIRKPKYAFQTRSQVDILDDGYRWRKYGQKAVKNNKFPRSYYRCTHQGCNVKKQVQRLTKDEGIVVTTYEGTHSHQIEKSTDNFEHILRQMQIYS
ncbi:probable WRKY transcription factor 75 [Populus alba]|nr:probable WRKY transcription factor 75 [Populus alba]KAJ7010098.1 WRKY transcription factor 75 [Populus alba x Populus x berolinensis]TKR84542.1 putative WRKY transcription factor 75 [Populus alba]